MPTIVLNRQVVEELVGKKLSDKEVQERIPLFGTPLEGFDEKSLHIEVFPNRPDMLSEQGFARAFSSFLGLSTGLRKYGAKKSEYRVQVDKSVADVRPFTACAVIKGLKLDDEKIRELIQVQEKLHITFCRKRRKAAIGIYPLDRISFPVTYTAQKPERIRFRPLEGDKEMTALQILSAHPTGREYAHLLEGKELFPVFRDAKDNVLSLPPIINSHDIGKVTEETSDVFVECTGLDRSTLSRLLSILVCALADMGGEVHEVSVEYPDEKTTYPVLESEQMSLDPSYVCKVLGLELEERQVGELLEKMGFSYDKGKVGIPCYRADILHPIDLVEDVAIAYGYENLTPEIPKVATIAQEAPFEVFKDKVREALIGLGLLECKTYNITDSAAQTERMGVDVPLIELANALTTEFNVLRAWVLPSLFQVLETNKNHEYPQNIFGLGDVFKADKTRETGVAEQVRVAVTLCDKKGDYTRARQVLDYLMRMLDLEYESMPASHDSFIPGRVSRIVCKGRKVAYLGEIAPQVLESWDLEMPVAAFELNLSELFEVVKG